MASEKVTAMIEEIKAMSVLELSELVHEIKMCSAFPPLPLLPPLRWPALLLPPRRRPSLTSF